MSEIETPAELQPTRVTLLGTDTNAFAIIGTVVDALKKAGNDKAVVDAFRKEAMSGDYDHVLQTAMAYAEVE